MYPELFYGLGPTLTEEQKTYLNAIAKKRIIFCNAKAGTGKTTLAVGMAKLWSGKRDLIYLFSPVEENKMGFRPGTEEEKMKSYQGPLIDALVAIKEDPAKAIVSEKNPEGSKKGHAWVHAKPHTFLRGSNLSNKTIIIDEAQNFTVSELRKVLTRLHDDCTVIVIGHTGQCDISPSLSGFETYLNHFKDEPYAAVVELTKNFRGEMAQHADKI